jgi:hypothetical protein
MNDPLHPQRPAGNPTLQPQHPTQIPRPQTAHPGMQPQIRPQQQVGLGGVQPPRPVVAPPKLAQPAADEPIALDEELAELEEAPRAAGSPTPSKIKFGPDTTHKKHEWKRKPHVSGTGAIRVRSFHAKYSEQGVEHLDDMINEWLDDHPDIEVKFVTQTVHVFEGKIREPALVMNVWY